MQKKYFPLKVTVVCALLAALSIVTGKFLAFNLGEALRFSFENTPIILAGVLFGPVPAALTAIVADLTGCLMVGYSINPVVTVGAAAIGLLSGLLAKLLKKMHIAPKLLLAVFVSHLVGSVLIKTAGLAAFYQMPFYILLLWRLLNYVIIGTVEFLLLLMICKNRSFIKIAENFSEVKK